MNRYWIPALVSLVLLGAIYAVAAPDASPSSKKAKLKGKLVIVSQKGMYHGVSKNVRFETVGQHDFIVIPAQHRSIKEAYDYWIPLRDVIDIKVFSSRQDAEAFEKSTSPLKKR